MTLFSAHVLVALMLPGGGSVNSLFVVNYMIFVKNPY
jgi:hypothetical protein